MNGNKYTSVTYVVNTTLIRQLCCCIVKERHKNFDSNFFFSVRQPVI